MHAEQPPEPATPGDGLDQRRDAILDAARSFGERDGVRNVSLGDIATAVGLAKSNVLRYFETCEQIYLHLTAEGWRDWEGALDARLAGRVVPQDELAAALAETLAARPLFCDLLNNTASNLEHNVSQDSIREYKLDVLATIDGIAALLADAVPSIGAAGGGELVAAASLYAHALWPISRPPAALATLYESDPEIARTCVDFAPMLQRQIRVLIAGLVAGPAAGPL